MWRAPSVRHPIGLALRGGSASGFVAGFLYGFVRDGLGWGLLSAAYGSAVGAFCAAAFAGIGHLFGLALRGSPPKPDAAPSPEASEQSDYADPEDPRRLSRLKLATLLTTIAAAGVAAALFLWFSDSVASR